MLHLEIIGVGLNFVVILGSPSSTSWTCFEQYNLWRDSSLRPSSPASASSWNSYPDPQLGYGQGGYPYSYDAHQLSYQPYYDTRPPPPQNYDHEPHTSGRVPRQDDKRKLERKYSRIVDSYNSIDEVTEALARVGLESFNLILGIDFTKSNKWTGMHSLNIKSLHHIGNGPNPYEQAISFVGKTLAAFDEDNLIPSFGFGDASTHDQDVFSFYPDEIFCNEFEEVLSRYREIVPNVRLAGPTSFAPVVEMEMTVVEQSGGQYHVLVINCSWPALMEIPSQYFSTIELDLLGSRKASSPQRVSPQHPLTVQRLLPLQNLMGQHLLVLQNLLRPLLVLNEVHLLSLL
ncbi:unnamed protein product [Vicia faba]|uniref:Copine C-terminal domain-containing protein n=1 Tax=Vicia faba TaxID=3906 RepID=A0AAV1AHP7_VICFA|nr:unnamed protein product [Vicia faba]